MLSHFGCRNLPRGVPKQVHCCPEKVFLDKSKGVAEATPSC
jgi:hypothetical protein